MTQPLLGVRRALVAVSLLALPLVPGSDSAASTLEQESSAAPGSIVTLAGGSYGDGLPGPEAAVVPRGLAIGPDGLLYVSDEGHSRIRRVAADGTVERFAGQFPGHAGDGGHALQASLHRPGGIDFDAEGNLYIADTVNNRIRKITPQGTITTIAGDGTRAFGGDGGPALNAKLSRPTDVAVDSKGNVFIADHENLRVRRVDAQTGVIETYAGCGLLPVANSGYCPYVEGAKATAVHVGAMALAIGPDDDLYLTSSCSVRRVDAETRTITTSVGVTNESIPPGTASCGYSGDGGPPTAAKLGGGTSFQGPMGLDISPDGRMWIADTNNSVVRVVGTDGIIRTVAGTGRADGPLGDGGPALNATLQYPMATAVDGAGNLYVATHDQTSFDPVAHERVRVIRPDGTTDTYAGNGGWYATQASGRPATGADFGGVNGLAWDDRNRLYIAAEGTEKASPKGLDDDPGGYLWRLDPDGRLHKVAGNGEIETLKSGDQTGDALSVPIYPYGIDVGPDGRIYFADAASWQIKVYDPVTETIDVVAGKKIQEPSRAPVPSSEPAAAAELVEPYGVSVAPNGDVYFSEGDHRHWADIGVDLSRVRRVRDGSVELVAGLAGGQRSAGFNGDGLPATRAMMRAPWGLDALPDGDLLVSEVENRRVRLYDAESGTLSTVAGDGAEDSRAGTLGQLSSLSFPRDVESDGRGGFFVADGECCMSDVSSIKGATHIVHVSASGMSSYVAGTGKIAPGSDGPALEQTLLDPRALALGSRGLAFADRNRVRLLIPPAGGWPDPPREPVCLPNATDVAGDSHGTIAVANTANNPNFDVLGTEVRTIGQDLEVTIELDDLDPATMWTPGDDEGQFPSWVFQIWSGLPAGTGRVTNTTVVYLAALATASIDDPGGAKPGEFVFEVGELRGARGIDEEGREQHMTVRRLGPATGTVDLVNDTVRIRAPLASMGLGLGMYTYRQYGIAGQMTQVTNGLSNFRDLTYYDTTPMRSRHRTIFFGRNCPDAWI